MAVGPGCRAAAVLLIALTVPPAAWLAGAPEPFFERLTIVAPAPPGGGWDQTARAMQRALVEAGAAQAVDVVNSPGAGGAIGLAEFVNAHRGDGNALLVGGLVMISAVRANRSTVSLAQTSPLARLTGDLELLAVPSDSGVRDLADLVRRMRRDPVSVSFAGGSIGGADHLLLNGIARAVGVDPARTVYVAYGGGREVAEALLAHQVTAGISGYGELATLLQAGRLRGLAVSSEARMPGLAVPTLKEQGIDLAFVNWRGVFAPPGLSDEQRERLQQALAAMRATEAWRRALAEHLWSDLYLPGDAFVEFLLQEEARGLPAPDPRRPAPLVPPRALSAGMWLHRHRAALTGAMGALLAGAAALLIAQRARAVRRERELVGRLEEAEAKYRRRSAQTQELLHGLTEQIESQFARWGLSAAEREIAWLMLKGLRHKEIASVRGRSERTVRTQALAIYRKAGLDGRTDLAAFFLEDLLQPNPPADQRTA